MGRERDVVLRDVRVGKIESTESHAGAVREEGGASIR